MLTQLGNVTKYPDSPEHTKLETFDNKHPDTLYLVPFVQPLHEFTSLCPRTGQPDVARIEFVYVPNRKMLESKSYKLYLFSFRNTGEFHEDVINRMAKTFFSVLKPKYLRVFGDFAPRGGIAIKPLVEKWQKGLNKKTVDKIVRLVQTWDIKQ